MKNLFLLLLFAITTIQLFGQKLTIAAASNAQYALKELVSEFKKDRKVEIDIITGSSGKLTTQIMQGAPYHLFFSADQSYPVQLYSKGFVYKKPQVYGYGSIVAWTMKDFTPSKDLEELKTDKVTRIAVANPDLAPYGKETIKLLQTINLYEEIKGKIITGESISQVNQYITTGNVDVGFTAKSIVVSSEMKGKGKWIELDEKYYSPIPQSVAFLKRGKEEAGKTAEEFLDFVFSNKGKEILTRNGYKIK